MKKRINFFILLIMFVMVTPSFAFTNICEMGKKALGMTTAQMKEFYEDNFKFGRIEGNGEVYDVTVDSNNNCTVIVRCESNVFIYIDAGDYWGSKQELTIGQKISFTGDCSNLDRQYFQNSEKRYIRAFVNDPFLKY